MPYHEFIVGDERAPLENVIWDKNKIVINGIEVLPQVSINDDFINYISDTLAWIKSRGPSDAFHGFGLDVYGYTIIRDKESLNTFRNIISSWKELFLNAPPEFIITGNYGWEAGSDKGRYEKISVTRNELIESLSKLIEVIDTALETNQCVIHFGI